MRVGHAQHGRAARQRTVANHQRACELCSHAFSAKRASNSRGLTHRVRPEAASNSRGLTRRVTPEAASNSRGLTRRVRPKMKTAGGAAVFREEGGVVRA